MARSSAHRSRPPGYRCRRLSSSLKTLRLTPSAPRTTTSNDRCAVLPDGSTAVHVTRVRPMLKVDADVGTEVNDATEQLSVAEGGGKLTAAPAALVKSTT